MGTNDSKFCEISLDASESHRKYAIKKNFFKKIDSPKKAYWLGFIYGDGNIHENKIQIGLQKKDQTLLEEFLMDIESEHKIYFDRGNPKIVIRNSEIVEDLKKLGVKPRKSLNLTPPKCDVLPKEFVRFFILGFFDADGHIKEGYKKKDGSIVAGGYIRFTGTKPMLEWINKKMSFLNCVSNLYIEKRSQNKKTWDLMLSMGFERKKRVFDYFYKGHFFGLKRKKEKFYVG